MKKIVFVVMIWFLIIQKINGQDSLKSLGCSYKPEPDTLKIKYSGLVICNENKMAIPKLDLMFCNFKDTTFVKTDKDGEFTTTLLIPLDRYKHRVYPKLIINNKTYYSYELPLTQYYLDTLGNNKAVIKPKIKHYRDKITKYCPVR